jgi:hypothetical protein
MAVRAMASKVFDSSHFGSGAAFSVPPHAKTATPPHEEVRARRRA